jgi:hypothetical protein
VEVNKMVSDSTVPRKDGASLGLEPNSMSSPEFGRYVIDKISRHLLWFLFLLFVFSFLDRINIGFAGLTMVGDLGLTGTQFGLATTLSSRTGMITLILLVPGILAVPAPGKVMTSNGLVKPMFPPSGLEPWRRCFVRFSRCMRIMLNT